MKTDTSTHNAAKDYAKDYIDALNAGTIGLPSNGYCWYCLELGTDMESSQDHLLSHVNEKYYAPSLIWDALDRMSGSDAQIDYVQTKLLHEEYTGRSDPSSDLEQMLLRYLYRCLGLAY
jgi:hypothetical protein